MFAPRFLIIALLALASPAISAPSAYPAPVSAGKAVEVQVPANIANYNNIEARSALGGRAAYHPFHTPQFQSYGHKKRMTKKQKKRACAAKPSSTGVPGQNGVVVPGASPTSAQAASTSVKPASSSSVAAPASTSTKPAVSSAAPSVAPTSSAPAPTTPASGFKSPDRDGNGPFSGQSTYYVLGTDGKAMGACGTNLVDSDLIAAASEYLFDSWPGANGNPNQNPICGQFAKVSYQGKSVVVRIADRCPGCEKRHLDLSPSAFTQLADESVGMMDVTWEWVGSASG